MPDHACRSVTVEVEGTHPEQLQDQALQNALQFFGGPASDLRVALFSARPVATRIDGSVAAWRADITVYLRSNYA